MDLDVMTMAWAVLKHALLQVPGVVWFGLVASVWFLVGLHIVRRSRNLEAQRRNDAAVRCHHGVNKLTRTCRKCVREFGSEVEREVAARKPNKFAEAIKAKPAVVDSRRIFSPSKTGWYLQEETREVDWQGGIETVQRIYVRRAPLRPDPEIKVSN